MKRAASTACGALLCGAAFAHPAPSSTLRLDFQEAAIHAEYWVPVSELTHARAADPGAEPFPAYLLRHFGLETRSGAAWRVTVFFEHTGMQATRRQLARFGIGDDDDDDDEAGDGKAAP